MNPKISVIIRTYNRADLVKKAIDSVLNQSFRDFEIVVADDGSTDGTKEVVERLMSKDGRIRFVAQSHSGGRPGKTLNLGLKACRAKYIAILDSDDEWLPKKLEKQLGLLESSAPDVGFVACNILVINPDGVLKEQKLSRGQSFLGSILKKNYLFPSSILAKKEIFDFIGPVDENFKTGEDWDMFIRIAEKYNYDFADEFLCKYYVHDSGLSYKKDYFRQAIDLEYLLKKHLELYQRYPKILEYRYNTLAFYLVNTGDMKKARYYLKKSLELNGSLKTWTRLALSYLGRTVYLKYEASRGHFV